jgi:hypothetical protein
LGHIGATLEIELFHGGGRSGGDPLATGAYDIVSNAITRK